MTIDINDSMLNKEYVHKGAHRLTLSFKGQSQKNGDAVNILVRSKNTELVCFVEDGNEKSEIRFSENFNHDVEEFEFEILLKQLFTPDEPTYAGFLISGRNSTGNTASEEFVIQCK